MLTTDLIVSVRASRRLSADQLSQLERMVFEGGAPSADQIALLMLIDSYLVRRDPLWADLLGRAVAGATAAVETAAGTAASGAESARAA